ncbi:peptidoglycan D,D-transpeptidase FtsI family protein [Umezawaea tangerina]|uniref:Cell elongation-specific peptidoglycan D,D-transpeptidase n=1 Tax=Umezawaea tangerina TaxID=84725 RepID=A0A2T0TJW9_9PSEU|nr:penicillin-binding protein 2 [Umezawaea tangerina]PRY45915.1 cell elongation-specific peptidoglycan D,D-transpeptidase [Umezawaea tangerina]
MNTPLRRVGIAMMVMILLLMGNATYVQVIKADDYRKDDHNRQRVLLNEYSRERGQIIASDGTPIANVKATDDSYRYQRVYANGPAYAPVTGYYSLTYGSGGVERIEDDLLNGSDDRLFARRLSDVITGRDPKGASLQLTVDPKVQQTAYDEMTTRGFTGSVVALNPQTGAILGMVSTPSYDPNRLASHDGDEQEKAWQEYTAEGGDQPTLNRAVQATYPPGSTWKVVVAAAALEDGKTKDTQLTAAPTITLPNTNTQLPNFNETNCGSGSTASMEEALARSCNTAFAELAGELGEQKLTKQANKFGMNDKELTVPQTVAASTYGPVPDKAALFQSGIGQRVVDMTPLENAVIAGTIANGGVRMKPYLVQKLIAPDLSVIDETKPDEAEDAISPQTANTLRDMMLKSETNTGGEGRLTGVNIASKTGTAEHGVDPAAVPPHAWYIAFAPAEKPTIAVAVIVENGGDRGLGATGGKVAAPVGRAVIGAYLAGR